MKRNATMLASAKNVEILRRLPGLRLPAPPVWRGFVPLHELEHLPVAWD
jgi:hypothetical protein